MKLTLTLFIVSIVSCNSGNEVKTAFKDPKTDLVSFFKNHQNLVNTTFIYVDENEKTLDKIDGLQTPLHVAVFTQKKELVKFLVKNGAKINEKNEFGFSPLHLATWKRNREIIETLLLNGADTQLKDRRGKTPIDYLAGFPELEKLIKK